MKLNYKKSGSGRPIIILHGLFGMLDNWQRIANELSSDFQVWLVDQRNHGRSPHDEVHTYDAMADDLQELITTEGIEAPIIVGHSMGGKTAMRFAQKFPESTAGIVVVDMGIRQYPIHHDTIVEGLKSIQVESLQSRAEADEQLEKHIPEFGVRQFLLKNLNRKKDGSYEWRFNLPVLEKELANIVSGLPGESSQVKSLFITGSRSGYVKDDDIPEIQTVFPNSRFEKLEAGHWIHAEKPEEVITLLREFCSAL